MHPFPGGIRYLSAHKLKGEVEEDNAPNGERQSLRDQISEGLPDSILGCDQKDDQRDPQRRKGCQRQWDEIDQ